MRQFIGTVSFEILKGRNNSGRIRLRFSYGRKKLLRYSTRLVINNYKNWDTKKNLVKEVLEEPDSRKINKRLAEIEMALLDRYEELSEDPRVEVTNELLKSTLDQLLGRKTVRGKSQNDKKNLLSYYNWYFNYYLSHPTPNTGRPLSKGTVKTYRNAYNILKRFDEEVMPVHFHSINLKFYEKFLEYMHEKEYSLNYIGTQVKILKTILSSALERGLHDNLEFQKRYFAKPQEKIDNIYLSDEELKKIFRHDYSGYKSKYIGGGSYYLSHDSLIRARDLFLIGAYTGLRVSDFNRLKEENIIESNGRKFIRIEQQKTSRTVTIPVHPLVQEILDSRNGKLPKKLPDQHINYALKEIGKIVGLDQTVNKSITKGGKKIINGHKKYELICNHTARRSFCTNAYLAKIPTADIMAISGHRTERVFYDYIKVNDLERAHKIADHAFFN